MSSSEKQLNSDMMLCTLSMIDTAMENIKIVIRLTSYFPEKRAQSLRIMEELCSFMDEVLADEC